MMAKISYAGYRFPPVIIQQAVWLYVRFTLSFRDVEDLLAERGIMVSYETVRRWVRYFGPMIAADQPRPIHKWRSGVLRPPVSMVSVGLEGDDDHPAGVPCAGAPCRLPPLLALERHCHISQVETLSG